MANQRLSRRGIADRPTRRVDTPIREPSVVVAVRPPHWLGESGRRRFRPPPAPEGQEPRTELVLIDYAVTDSKVRLVYRRR